jgi:8-oxo-dGTP pyrophosphatase MutT (NUDIX family)
MVSVMSDPPETLPRSERFAVDLQSWHPQAAGQESLKLEYLDLLGGRGEDALDRDGGREHLTGSCFIFTPNFENILLCFHKKGQFWIQVGGHIEPEDDSVSAAAFREAVEESGIADIEPIVLAPLDLDRHSLGSGFVRCDVHWDVGFGATAAEGAVPLISNESDDVRWWPLASLPAAMPHGFAGRLHRIVAAIRELA